MYIGFRIKYMLILFMYIFLKIPTNYFYMSSCKLGVAVNYKEIVTMREDESNLVMNIKVHEFVNKDTWQLHLALHANDVLIGVAFANPGNTKYDNETVVAAMQCLKNDYYEAIGSPMRYHEGKLIFLPADQGLIAKWSHTTPEMKMQHASSPGRTVALSH